MDNVALRYPKEPRFSGFFALVPLPAQCRSRTLGFGALYANGG